MEPQCNNYRAYMLRLWRAGNPPMAGQTASWRASLESPHTGECIGFGSLAELFSFLQEEVERCEAGNEQKCK
ncbi:MAG: hypothetical protein U0350_50095 [Caldilineaceae bacterium]